MPVRYLDTAQLRKFYDSFGRKQDWQSFYEGPAMREMIEHGGFGSAGSVFELGFGTGAFALELLKKHLPKTATYTGVDISSTMSGLAEKRLSPFEVRVNLTLSDGSFAFSYKDEAFDRFVANYVLDLLPPEDMRKVITEARRILKPAGLVCLLSLTRGTGPLSRAVTWAWSRLFKLNPGLVGGCRPVELVEYMDADAWNVEHHNVVSPFGVASEILVAEKVG